MMMSAMETHSVPAPLNRADGTVDHPVQVARIFVIRSSSPFCVTSRSNVPRAARVCISFVDNVRHV